MSQEPFLRNAARVLLRIRVIEYNVEYMELTRVVKIVPSIGD